MNEIAPHHADELAIDVELEQTTPRATYRLQLTADFTFDDAARIADYLAALGISHVYSSPWLKSRSGSVHGYDIIDHNALNPELGGTKGFKDLSARLATSRLKHILDFVPNHMGVARADNAWWLDVLEWGKASPYAGYFDIDWNAAPRLRNKVLLPFLGDHYGHVLESRKLVPRFDAANGGFSVWYFDHSFPINARHYSPLIRRALAISDSESGLLSPQARETLGSLADAFDQISDTGSAEETARWRQKAEELKKRLAKLALEDSAVTRLFERAMAAFGGETGVPDSFQALHNLLEEQHYRLAYWGVASDEINYRRFFNINELAGIRIENPHLFAEAHRLVGELIRENALHGLRIDHIDGLYDPAEYCRRLRAFTGEAQPGAPFYIVVEKILARHERLREEWPIQGTTGYEFLASLNQIFVDSSNERAMTRAYQRFVDRPMDVDEILIEAKHWVMDHILGGELAVLARDLDDLSERHWNSRDYTLEGLRSALKAIVAQFPVYRTYVTADGASSDDRRDIVWATAKARKSWRGPGKEIFDFIESVLTTDILNTGDRAYDHAEVVRFAMHVQQFTGPVMAKSMEDTTFYRYHRLRSLNEVGSDPRQFGISPQAFHHFNQERAARWPQSMLTTATHDTKLGEDVRARINVLSELPREWSARVTRWASLNRRKKRQMDGYMAPRRNDEYLLYQTLLGAWPLADWNALQATERDAFTARIRAYMKKAVREASVQSSWANPDVEYEEALDRFISQILDLRTGQPFLADFLPFQKRIAEAGMRNSLAQLALKMTCPGVPDIYQGNELWDLHLVDPDNRTAVDFELRRSLLNEVEAIDLTEDTERTEQVAMLARHWQDGRIKLYATRRCLRLRKRSAKLFVNGDYQPLETAGPAADRVIGFQLRLEGDGVIVMAGRFFTRDDPKSPQAAWIGTDVRLPDPASGIFEDVLTGRRFDTRSGTLGAAELFATLPVAILIKIAESA